MPPRGIQRAETREETRLPPRDPSRVRVRKHRGDVDQFHVDLDLKPEGQSWNWKRMSTYGQEDRENTVFVYDQGWEPVDGAVIGGKPGKPVEVGGMMLMERPQELTDAAMAEDLARANEQVKRQNDSFALSTSHLSPKTSPKIKTSYGPMEVAE